MREVNVSKSFKAGKHSSSSGAGSQEWGSKRGNCPGQKTTREQTDGVLKKEDHCPSNTRGGGEGMRLGSISRRPGSIKAGGGPARDDRRSVAVVKKMAVGVRAGTASFAHRVREARRYLSVDV